MTTILKDLENEMVRSAKGKINTLTYSVLYLIPTLFQTSTSSVGYLFSVKKIKIVIMIIKN